MFITTIFIYIICIGSFIFLIWFLFNKIKKHTNYLPKKITQTEIEEEDRINYNTPIKTFITMDIKQPHTNLSQNEIVRGDMSSSIQIIQHVCLYVMKQFSISEDVFPILFDSVQQMYYQNIEPIYTDILFHIFCNTQIPILKRLEIGTFLIWKSSNQNHIIHIYNTIFQIIDNKSYNRNIRMNAIDILIQSNNKKYIDHAQFYLNQLRQEERHLDVNLLSQNIQNIRQQINKLGKFPSEESHEMQEILYEQYRRLTNQLENIKKRKKTVYNDSQNVHNHEINESVINSSKNLILNDEFGSNHLNIMNEFKRVLPPLYYDENKQKIQDSIHRIDNDVTKFKDGITMKKVYNKILSIISQSKHKDEMIKRLGEELIDMNLLCSTGHLSRLINVIQGFEDVPDMFKIQINPKDEIYANISTYITSEIQSSHDPDLLLTDMVEKKEHIFPFLVSIMKPKIKQLQNEYHKILDKKKLLEYVTDAIKTYLDNEQDAIFVMNSLNI